MSLKTPVLLIVWKRPDLTKKVLHALKAVKPAKLYVACDGPRQNRPEEFELVMKTKDIVKQTVNWPCEVHYRYCDYNQGCAYGVSNAISWFFSIEEEGIILEDDCVPHPLFFDFCSVMLERYRNNTQIMHIGGVNYHFGEKFGSSGYYFSKYCHIWGWATWRRAWGNYSLHIVDDEKLIKKVINRYCEYPNEQAFWFSRFREQINLEGDTWDFQWLFAVWINSGIAIYPNFNLVVNIGLNEGDSTHKTKTVESLEINNNLSIEQLLKKPGFNLRHIWADNLSYHRAFGVSKNISVIKKLYIFYKIVKHKIKI